MESPDRRSIRGLFWFARLTVNIYIAINNNDCTYVRMQREILAYYIKVGKITDVAMKNIGHLYKNQL